MQQSIIEGFRDGTLDALCAASTLADTPNDRTLTLGKTRTTHLYSYSELGLVFVFLDSPWALYEIRLAKSSFTLSDLRIDDPVSTAWDQFDGIPTVGRRSDTVCMWRWDTTTVYAGCPLQGKADLIEQVAVRNPALPPGCSLSHRGMYE